jgi:hypothetical protein
MVIINQPHINSIKVFTFIIYQKISKLVIK